MERTWSCLDCRFDDAEPLCFTAGGTFDPQRLARMLLKIKPADGAAAEEKSDRMRAHDCVDEMVQNAPGPAVAFILAALDVCETGAQVAVLGAGPLETLLKAQDPRRSARSKPRRASTRKSAICCRRRGARRRSRRRCGRGSSPPWHRAR